MKSLDKKVLAVASIASKNSARPVLCGVLFRDGKMVATDSYKLLEIGLDQNLDASEFPVSDQQVMQNEANFILPAESLKKIKFNKKAQDAFPILSNAVFVDEADKHVSILTSDLVEESKIKIPKIEGNFPPLSKIFPEGEGASVVVDIKYLKEMVWAFEKAGCKSVKLTTYGKLQGLVLTHKDNNVRGVIMPQRLED